MPATFFAPTVKNTGAALFVSFNSKDGSVFFRVVKQTGWNSATRTGSFSGGESFNLKLSDDEAADFIRAVRERSSVNIYHSFNGSTTTGSFRYYAIKEEGTNKITKQGFGLTLKKGDSEYKVGFTLAAAERLSLYLQFALDHIFSAIYAEDKKEFEKYMEKKNGTTPEKKVPAKAKKKVEPEPEEVTETESNEDVNEEANPPELETEVEEINW